jgi:hypothetical protein
MSKNLHGEGKMSGGPFWVKGNQNFYTISNQLFI